jgi:hypothetical protein
VVTNGELGDELISEIMRSIAKTYNWEEFLPDEIISVSSANENTKRIAGKYVLDPIHIISVYEKQGFFIRKMYSAMRVNCI